MATRFLPVEAGLSSTMTTLGEICGGVEKGCPGHDFSTPPPPGATRQEPCRVAGCMRQDTNLLWWNFLSYGETLVREVRVDFFTGGVVVKKVQPRTRGTARSTSRKR